MDSASASKCSHIQGSRQRDISLKKKKKEEARTIIVAAQPFVIYKAQTLSLSIMASALHQHTEGLRKQDTDGGNHQGDHNGQKSSVTYCC